MIDVQKKAIKTIDDYRHSIKVLKYHLKKQKKTNEKLQYEAAKTKHRPYIANSSKNRVYQLNETVHIISDRLKRMGLILEDVFRMADCKYEGEVNKEQFMRVVGKIKTDLNDSVFMEMFYAIDTSLNGLISEDQFLEFAIAYGGCSDAKQIRRYQNKVRTKLFNLIIKKYGSVEKFLENFRDPAPIDKLSTQLKSLGLSNNEQMIMLKTLDPSHQGSSTHKYILSILAQTKIKSQKEQEEEQSIKNISQLCVLFRDSKINPIVIYEEADVDGRDGVSSFQLEQAFRKVLGDRVNSFQVKKWVGLINTDGDAQITKNQYLRAIEGFYTINQISKFSQENDAKHPKPKKTGQPSQQSIEITLKKLSNALQDRGMKHKEAFNYIDVNNSGDIDQKQLFQGLKSLGLDIKLVGNVISLFDRDDSKKIQLQEWMKVLGADGEMSEVAIGDVDLDNFDDLPAKGGKTPKKGNQKVKKAETNMKNPEKDIENKVPNKSGKKSPSASPDPSPSPKKIEKQPSKVVKKPTLKQQPQKKIEPEKPSTLKKKDTMKQSKKQEPKKEVKPEIKPEKPSGIQNKKFAEDDSIKFSKIDSKKSKQSEKNDMKKKQSEVKMKKVESLIEDQEVNVDQVEERIAIQYKKNKNAMLKKFKEQDKSGKGFVTLKGFNEIMKKLEKDLPENSAKELFMKNCTNGNEFKYQDWLEETAELYAQEVEEQNQAEEEEESPKKDEVHQQQKDEEQEEEEKPKQVKPKINEEKKQKQLINNLIPKLEKEDTQEKRGENLKAFEILQSLIHKEGEKVEKGYKLFDYISDQQGELGKMRQKLLQKAEQIKKANKRFQDKEFPNSQKSIIKDKSKPNITNYNLLQWRHYSQIFKNPVLFQGEIEPNDIKQEQLGDCYFLSSLAGLAQYRNLIERLFEYFDMENGYFLVWLCIDGMWRLVQVDGYLPVWPHNLKLPAFSHSEQEEIWVSIIEKAYAKSYGDYNKIVGGQPFEAIKDLTGGPGMQYNFNKFKMQQIWQKLNDANKKQYIMTAGTKAQEMTGKIEGHDQNVTSTGIVLGHAYSILDLQEVSGERILKLRNPWGKFEWKGDDGWSDTGKKWTPEMKKKLNHQINQNDGIFWITLQQFYSNFLSCSINFIRPQFFYRSGQLTAVQQILIYVPTKDFNDGYLMACHRDHRHDGIPINTPYDGIYNLLGFVYSEKEGRVLERFDEKNFLYQREGFVEFLGVGKYPEGSLAMLLINLNKSANITIGYYGDKAADFEIERNCLPYIEKIAYLDQNSKKAQTNQNLFKMWESSVQGFVFICFKNLQKEVLTLKVTLKQPKNVRPLPPFAVQNTLKIKQNEIQSIRLKITAYPYSYSYGIAQQ